MAPYVKVDFGERVHTSQWSQLLLPYIPIPNSSFTQPPKDAERDQFASLLGEPNVSPLALQSLWKEDLLEECVSRGMKTSFPERDGRGGGLHGVREEFVECC